MITTEVIIRCATREEADRLLQAVEFLQRPNAEAELQKLRTEAEGVRKAVDDLIVFRNEVVQNYEAAKKEVRDLGQQVETAKAEANRLREQLKSHHGAARAAQRKLDRIS